MTLNNYTPEEVEHLRTVAYTKPSKIKYITWNQEVGENGTPHLQIYAQAFEKLSIAAWHKALGPRVANIVPSLNQERALKYCQGFEFDEALQDYKPKAGSSPFEEHGRKPEQGARTDIHSAHAEILKRPLAEVMLSNEHTQVISTHYTFFKDLDQLAQADRAFKAARIEHNEFMAKRTIMAWEQELQDIISLPPCPRSIHWFVDTVGETGKTINAKSLYFNHQAFYCTGGKASDIAHAYQYQPIVVFNLVASQDKETQAYLYTVLEQFKDGIFSSGKYNSMIKTFKIPHVIVMSNDYPDTARMKKSRIVVHDIQKLMHPSPPASPPPAQPGRYLQEALSRKAGKLAVAPFFQTQLE